ncbi:MAG: LacI family DNA-binding transcriptional regulator [Clostridiales bacterium]|jgi:DNA-binding LacI/PurR family transcriptional regulator|nr:LacI family DNA-binding transcriptional regulator [Clostridiales bacterium]
MSGISMRELAEILGVSVASVSVALRGRAGISEDTRARILAEARKRA